LIFDKVTDKISWLLFMAHGVFKLDCLPVADLDGNNGTAVVSLVTFLIPDYC